MNYWERITVLNEHFGITMRELEKRAGLAHGALPRKKPDDYCPRTTTLEKICNVYGITIADFFMDEYDFKELDLSVEKNKLLKILEQLTDEEQKVIADIIKDHDSIRFYEKCYAIVKEYDKDNKYASFEDYLQQNGVAKKLLTD